MGNKDLHYIDVKEILRDKAPKLAKKIPGFVIWLLKRLIHQNKLNKYVVKVQHTQGINYFETIIKEAKISINVEGFDKIDKDKQYIFVANHPLGGIDGAVIITVLAKKYKKIKAFVNDLLLHMKYAYPVFLPINKHGKNSKEYAKIGDEAYNSGNQILVFPAGLCSRKSKGIVCDPIWRSNFIKKAIEKKIDIVPIYFEGKNSRMFYFITKLRKFLGIKFNIEMILLAHEFTYHEGKTFNIKFGEPISYLSFDKKKHNYKKWAQIIQEKTYMLGGVDISKINLNKLI